MKFVVRFRDGSIARTREYPHVVLQQDNWDDYGYKTTFDATLKLTGEDEEELGPIKILKSDQTNGFTPMPSEPFATLGREYCSLGGSLDYYEKLYKRGAPIYRPYLNGLGDVAFSDDVRARFEDKEGYKVSLLRFGGAERTIEDASRLFAGEGARERKGEGFSVKFKTTVSSGENSFTINFDFRDHNGLPNRLNALIGYNGTGKTRLLSNLAIVASGYGYKLKEDILAKRAGRFVGPPPPFRTVIVVSYSAFDTFVIPGRTQAEKRRLRKEGDIFGYVYCGLRERSDDNDAVDDDEVLPIARGETYRLRTPLEIELEFERALQKIHESERGQQFLAILRPLLADGSFQRIGLTHLYADQKPDLELFRSLSSGHKVVLKIVSEIIAHIDGDRPSLVLIDEPETHLHPPLLAAFLKSIRACLEHFDGYAVVATHSPVVLQETPSRYVRVLRRVGNKSRVDRPKIETFAENIGVITQSVFNLDDGSTDWHDTLRKLVRTRDLAEIERMFGRRLGFAARSYIAELEEDASE
jgi:hypothetical protein